MEAPKKKLSPYMSFETQRLLKDITGSKVQNNLTRILLKLWNIRFVRK